MPIADSYPAADIDHLNWITKATEKNQYMLVPRKVIVNRKKTTDEKILS